MESLLHRQSRQGSKQIPENVKEKYLELNLTDGVVINVTADQIEYHQNENLSSLSNKRQDNENEDGFVSRIRKRMKTMEGISEEHDEVLLDHESRILSLEKSTKRQDTALEALDEENTYHHEKITEQARLLVGQGEKFMENGDKFIKINETLAELRTALLKKDIKGFRCEVCKNIYSTKYYLPRHKCRAQ